MGGLWLWMVKTYSQTNEKSNGTANVGMVTEYTGDYESYGNWSAPQTTMCLTIHS